MIAAAEEATMQDDRQGGSGFPGGFDALARQYWNAWGEALRAAAPGATQAGAAPWQEALDWWSRAAQGGRLDGNDVVERFNAQSRHWLGQMQQVAAQFAGQPASAADIARAWKSAMESAGGNPFLDLLHGMRGPGLQGFEQWFEQASPYLEGLRGESLSWLRMPTFGFTREHQERWQKLVLAMADCQQCTQAHDELMRQATRDACAIFEDKLAEREAPGRQLQSARALFDLWVDAAEEAYAKVALSKEFREAYGRLVDAQMRLRAGVQREVELAGALFGMPTRTEVDAAHRRIVELERQLRRMRDGAQPAAAQAQPAATARKPAAKPAKQKAPAAGKAAKPRPQRAARATSTRRGATPVLPDIAPPAAPGAKPARGKR
jgi:class III poly(R)-hydroxyalkanoic acid synthase PhaE subunit